MKNLKIYLYLFIITGFFYPLIITLIGQLALPYKANGSFVLSNKKVVGSELIAQKFEKKGYFWPRPSSINYKPLPSSGSNLAPTSKELKSLVEARRKKWTEEVNITPFTNKKFYKVPAELLYASGSGIDPHISIRAAFFQMARIVKARPGLDEVILKKIIVENIEVKHFVLDPYVNVLKLNILLDQRYPIHE
ncbi:MAG: potassium-transporting ATPase subunit C [Chlamydia sp. 32-24]|nr:MAG: potassium-transporting ATPase subunit C [Chlamydia sp. 32-24]